MEYIYKDFSKINTKEGKNNINSYVNMVTKVIKEETKDRKKYREIHFNMQNNNIIIRTINILNVRNKKDIEAMIEFEITQYMPINIKDYELKYKILNTTEKELCLQVILMPKYMIDICREISKMLNMKPKNLSINFDILQKMISHDLIKGCEDRGVFIESKKEEFILNKVENKIIQETYIIPKTHQSYQTIEKLTEEYKQIYYYGIEDKYNFEQDHNIQTPKINKEIYILNDKMYIKCEDIEHINSIGMVI